MLSRFGIEASQAAQYVIAFVIILVLVALFGLVLRRLTGGRLMLPGQDRGRARQPRLGIVDIYDLDRQRQLILLRRDNVEHLLLIGGPNDVVIETNIVRVAGARLPTTGEPSLDRADAALERAPEFPARPQVENGRPSLEAQIAARLNDLVARPSEQSDADQELSAVGTATASVPLRVEPPLKPDTVTGPAGPAPVPGPVPGPGAGFRPSRTEPVMPEPPRPPASEPPQVRAEPRPTPSLRPVPPPRPVTAPEPVRPAPARPSAPQPPAPPPAQTGEGRAPEAGILSDMAKQLEQALRRPGQSAGEPAGGPQRGSSERPPVGERDERPAAPSGPQPAPAPNAAPQGPARPTEPPRPAVEPVRPVPLRPEAARGPVEPVRPEPVRPEPPRPEPVRPDQGRREPMRPEPPRPEPARPEPVRPEPARPEPVRPEPARPEPVRPEPPRQETARPEPAKPEPVRAEPPRPAPAAPAAAAEPPASAPKRTVDDPFSVEEIEAEFARLLGRPVDKSDRN